MKVAHGTSDMMSMESPGKGLCTGIQGVDDTREGIIPEVRNGIRWVLPANKINFPHGINWVLPANRINFPCRINWILRAKRINLILPAHLIQCDKERCKKPYIGLTTKQVRERMCQHLGYVTNKTLSKAAGEHFICQDMTKIIWSSQF